MEGGRYGMSLVQGASERLRHRCDSEAERAEATVLAVSVVREVHQVRR